MYICPKCEPGRKVSHGYSIAYCPNHTPKRLSIGCSPDFEHWVKTGEAATRARR